MTGGFVIPFRQDDTKIEVVNNNGISQEISVPWWVLTPDKVEKLRQIEQSQFFLVRQGEMGEISRCRECNGKHIFYTLRCVERPFDGIQNGLHAYWYHTGRYGAENFLSDVELQRYQAIAKVISRGQDLASAHPETSKRLGTQDNDFDAGTVSLGILEPITRQKAEALAWNINAKGIKPPFRLKGLERGTV